MEREILFHGKRKINGAWVYGDLSLHKDNEPYIRRWHCGTYQTYEVDPATVGQYTGLTDKNGEKVFEGDILKFHNAYNDTEWVCSVHFKNGMFVHQYLDGTYNHPDCWHELVTWLVIGNIHDNPELLEVEP